MELCVALFGNFAGLVAEPVDLALAKLPVVAQSELKLLLGQAGGEATHDKLEAGLLGAIRGAAGRTGGGRRVGVFLQNLLGRGQHAVGSHVQRGGRRRHGGRAAGWMLDPVVCDAQVGWRVSWAWGAGLGMTSAFASWVLANLVRSGLSRALTLNCSLGSQTTHSVRSPRYYPVFCAAMRCSAVHA